MVHWPTNNPERQQWVWVRVAMLILDNGEASGRWNARDGLGIGIQEQRSSPAPVSILSRRRLWALGVSVDHLRTPGAGVLGPPRGATTCPDTIELSREPCFH
ncbi:hypothetical protein KQX54_000514 [Cotesia glomerata]|uniref:Uncharacterized protein n=1 Tax=Cotesia glomerata TaxID=32391 RepID=A0AAV7IW78_COTGL|nr:hypothetical protein KQX54_000514 [Cotesia glomerata]